MLPKTADDLDTVERFGTLPEEMWDTITTPELIVLDAVRRGVARSQIDADAAQRLMERGLIEPGGRGDTPFIYSEALAPSISQGLLILPVIQALASFTNGASLSELKKAVGTQDTEALKRTLQWMRRSELVYTSGRTRGARWHLHRDQVLDILQQAKTNRV